MSERLKFIKTYWRMRKQVREENKKVNIFLAFLEAFYCSEYNRGIPCRVGYRGDESGRFCGRLNELKKSLLY